MSLPAEMRLLVLRHALVQAEPLRYGKPGNDEVWIQQSILLML